jgi:hypothetical protein
MKIINLNLILLLLVLNSCGYLILKPVSNSYIKKHKKELLPESFFEKGNVLVVLLDEEISRADRLYNKKIQAKVSKLYRGKTVFLTLDKYKKSNNANYRFIFTHTLPVLDEHSGHVAPRKFYLLDTKTQETFICNKKGAFYMRIVESYFKNLEKWRIRNESTKSRGINYRS